MFFPVFLRLWPRWEVELLFGGAVTTGRALMAFRSKFNCLIFLMSSYIFVLVYEFFMQISFIIIKK